MMYIYYQVTLWKGAKNMAKHDETDRDVDDMIFEGEDWAPSGR